jgi:hypothetical protein
MKDYNMPVPRLQGRDAQTLCKNLRGFRKMQQNACRAGTTKLPFVKSKCTKKQKYFL